MFSKGAKYTSKSARTDIQFINRITHDDRGRNFGIRRGMRKNRESSKDVFVRQYLGYQVPPQIEPV
jgi:hypothetical protein